MNETLYQHLARPSSQAEKSRALELLSEMVSERKLVLEGAAGQSAAPPGMGAPPALEHDPGGDLVDRIQHPAFTTVEHLFRALPEDTWSNINLNPQRPIKFELGAFTVPKGQIFFLMDYEFVALEQSGLDPFDFQQADPYRFSGFMGFDVRIGGRLMSNLFYQLDPAPVQFARPSFERPIGVPRAGPAEFNRAAANSFGSVAGEGTSLLPVRSNVQGPRALPFTMIGQGGDKVSLSVVIFRRITAALAGIQGSVSGYSIHENTASALLNRIRPR